jgi:threonine dehydratase
MPGLVSPVSARLISFRTLPFIMVLTLADIEGAQRRIAGHCIRTPLVFSPTLSRMTGADVYLKLEMLQMAGSFKVRGAVNKILLHKHELGNRRVVAASAGNHAQGVAVAAHLAGVPATIVMPAWASISKQEATRGYGADVAVTGNTLEESIGQAHGIAREGHLFIHPYDDEEVIAGQGTIGLEILADLPTADLVVVPVGGGGLISGIATAIKSLRPAIRIIGVQAMQCPSAYESVRSGEPVEVTAGITLADGIRVTRTGDIPLPILRQLVDSIVLVDEEEIADAMLLLLERKRVVAEGAGATPVAALLNGSIPLKPGMTVVLVLSGGNIDSLQLERVILKALARQGRILRISAVLEDRPGTLAAILNIVAELKGNIVRIRHDPGERDLPVQMVRVELGIETRSHEHGKAIFESLEKAGYPIKCL